MMRAYACILCPNGCDLTVEYEGETVLRVEGGLCPKGGDYVGQELTDPHRNIATSIPVDGGELPLVSVRLDTPIPKRDIFKVMTAINAVRVTAPTLIGQVVIPDVCGLGSNVIITKSVALKGRRTI